MAALGIVQGYPDGTFGPSNPITRAEFATIVSRFEMFAGVSEDMFGDDNGHWAERYINSTAQNGWVQGYEDGSFRPEGEVTRAEMAKMIILTFGLAENFENAKGFPDVAQTEWFYPYVLAIQNIGIWKTPRKMINATPLQYSHLKNGVTTPYLLLLGRFSRIRLYATP